MDWNAWCKSAHEHLPIFKATSNVGDIHYTEGKKATCVGCGERLRESWNCFACPICKAHVGWNKNYLHSDGRGYCLREITYSNEGKYISQRDPTTYPMKWELMIVRK